MGPRRCVSPSVIDFLRVIIVAAAAGHQHRFERLIGVRLACPQPTAGHGERSHERQRPVKHRAAEVGEGVGGCRLHGSMSVGGGAEEAIRV